MNKPSNLPVVDSPIVSTALICYNQEHFVSETLNGIRSQVIGLEHQIICGDDASKDGTRSILEKHQSDSRINVLASTNNLGMHGNWARTIEACQGEFIAICEGDDVWTDPKKLQKQIAILEKNPDASACFSNANIIDSEGVNSEFLYVDKDYDTINPSDFFKLNFNPIPTCTVVFRKSAFTGFPKEYYDSPFADWILHTILIQNGPYVYLPDVTSSYRQHAGGLWTGIQEEQQMRNKLKAMNIMLSIVSPKYKSDLNTAISKQLDKMLYLYREQKNWWKYFIVWTKLKLL